jgi:cell shape-determining protein MreC
MSITTEEAERLVELGKVVPDGSRRVAAAISTLVAERDALRAENARIKELLKEVGSLAASRAGRVDVLEAENARLREAFQKYFGQSEATNTRALAKEENDA